MKLVEVSTEYINIVQDILDDAPFYYMKIEGVKKVKDSAIELFEEVPPKTSIENKHVFLISKEDKFIGVCDFIVGYPSNDIGFIGLLLLRESYQGKGLGKMAYQLIQDYAKSLDLKHIQIAVQDSNPVEMYWKKMGFTRSGREIPFNGLKVKSIRRVMEKAI